MTGYAFHLDETYQKLYRQDKRSLINVIHAGCERFEMRNTDT